MNAEPSLQFVDTNILVYAYDQSQGEKHEQAKTLLLSLWDSGLGCMSTQVLQEFFVSVTCKSKNPLSAGQAVDLIHDFSVWNVHRPTVRDVISAIDLHRSWQVSFWDAMILQSAQQSGCSLVWTEDLTDGKDYAGVKVVNPFAGN